MRDRFEPSNEYINILLQRRASREYFLYLLLHLPVFLFISENLIGPAILYPTVLQYLLRTQSQHWIHFQQLRQKISAFCTQLNRNDKTAEFVLLGLLLERRTTYQHLVYQYSDTPAVYFVIVIAAFSHLRGNVIQRATQRFSESVCFDRPSEVSYFEVLSQTDDVFRFKISMYDTVTMQIFDTLDNLSDIFSSFLFVEGSRLKYLLIEIMIAIFHDEVDLVLANVEAVGGKNMRVLAVQVYFDLIDEVFKFDFVFAEGFDSDQHGVDVRDGEENVTCLAFANFAYHFEFVLGRFGCFVFGHLFESLIHIFQFESDWSLFFEEFIGQTAGRVIALQFFFDVIDASRCSQIILENLLGVYGVLTDFFRRRGFILGAFGIGFGTYNFMTTAIVIFGSSKNCVIDFLVEIRFESDCVVAGRIRSRIGRQFLIGVSQIWDFDLEGMNFCRTVVCFCPLHIIINQYSIQFYWQMSQISPTIERHDDPLTINMDTVRQHTIILQDPPARELISQPVFQESQFLSQMTTPLHHRHARLSNHSSNAANIFRVKHGSNSEKKDKLTYVRFENYTSSRSRKTTEQKIFEINNFVKKLTDNINRQDEMPQITDTKFRALKKIIEYYDIKNLDRSEYDNVIKSFGLQIGSVRTGQKALMATDRNYTQKRVRPINSLLERTQKKLCSRQIFSVQAQKKNDKNTSHSLGASVSQKNESLKKAALPLEDKTDGSKLFSSLQMHKNKIREKSMKKHFKFNTGENCIREKINKFREFLFALNYSNRLYRNMDLQFYPHPVKYFVGVGNNSNLIRSLMKKRFWFEEVPNEREANFVWTQIKLPQVFERQSVVQQKTPAVQKKNIMKMAVPKLDPLTKILNVEEYRQMVCLQETVRNRGIDSFQDRLRLCPRALVRQEITEGQVIHNHLPENGLLGNKKALFYCLREYCGLMEQNVFDIVPLTFIISQGLLDPQYNRLAAYYNQKKSKKKPNYWIMKPGEFSNRGNGIQCTNKLEDIRKRIIKCSKERKRGSIIVQEYMVKPLLYNGRKFDIRAYMMMTWHNGKAKAYWYQEGYVRTSSHFFTLEQMGDSYIHLTNDAVQQHSETYGRFQEGNKLSYPELQRYLDTLPANGRNLDLHQVILPQMRTIAATAIKSSWVSINPRHKDKNFELFGLDFMIDEHFKPWLIEVNTNPCLEMSSPVLERIIPYMVQNLLRIALDPIFPPPDNFSNNFKYNIPENSLHYNKFELIFDSDRDGPQLLQLYEGREVLGQLLGMQEDKQEYKQEGELLNLQDL